MKISDERTRNCIFQHKNLNFKVKETIVDAAELLHRKFFVEKEPRNIKGLFKMM